MGSFSLSIDMLHAFAISVFGSPSIGWTRSLYHMCVFTLLNVTHGWNTSRTEKPLWLIAFFTRSAVKGIFPAYPRPTQVAPAVTATPIGLIGTSMTPVGVDLVFLPCSVVGAA